MKAQEERTRNRVTAPLEAADIRESLRSVTPYRERLRTMFGNRRWLAANIEQVMAQYRDHWIVVWKEAVQAAAPTPEAALAACPDVDIDEAVVLLVPDRIQRPI